MSYQEEPVVSVGYSRSEKIREAKAAFHPNSTTSAYDNEKAALSKGLKHPFSLFRIFLAGMLFFILLAAFELRFSYHGFNEQLVRKALNRDCKWEYIIDDAVTAMKHLKDTF